MKTIRVVAAIIVKKDRIFATQRGYGEFKGGWEFPGGKIEEGETPQQALIREIREELDTEIEVSELVERVEYDYPQFHLSMDCFLCKIKSGKLVLKEHEDLIQLLNHPQVVKEEKVRIIHNVFQGIKTVPQYCRLIFHNHAHAYGYHKFRSPFTGLISLTSQPQFIMMKSTEPYLFSQTDIVGKSIVS